MNNSPQGTAKLHLGHFAFIRSVVQGLDIRRSWARCFGTDQGSADLRLIKSQISRIRDELSAAARREGRFGTARLVLIDTASIPDSDLALPTLEDFALSRGLADFSEREQLAAYEEEFGRATQAARRRARLIARQLEAIQWLESLVSKPPQADHPIEAWLNPAQAARLQDAGLATLGDLIEHINRAGRTWYQGVPTLGASKAARVTAWLNAHEDTIGLSVQDEAAERIRTTASPLPGEPPADIRVLAAKALHGVASAASSEHAHVSSTEALKALDTASEPSASDDDAAIADWLGSKWPDQQRDGLPPKSNHAHRAYRREAERFVLWCAIERSKRLATVGPDDCAAYELFLSDPQPRDRWCGLRSGEKATPHWRPFEGPLSPGAQRQAITILRNLFRFLAEHGYRTANPWARLPARTALRPSVDASRSFTAAQWQFIADQLDRRSATAAQHRLGVGLRWLHATGARLSELMAARTDDLTALPGVGAVWRIGRGGRRQRDVPVPQSLLDNLGRHLARRGLPGDPLAPANRGAYLIGKPARPGAGVEQHLGGIAAPTFHAQVKSFFIHCGRMLRAEGKAEEAVQFEAASTHWLRHTHARHALQAGVPIDVARHHLGHASIATTALYLEQPPLQHIDAMREFWSRAAGASIEKARGLPKTPKPHA